MQLEITIRQRGKCIRSLRSKLCHHDSNTCVDVTCMDDPEGLSKPSEFEGRKPDCFAKRNVTHGALSSCEHRMGFKAQVQMSLEGRCTASLVVTFSHLVQYCPLAVLRSSRPGGWAGCLTSILSNTEPPADLTPAQRAFSSLYL